MSEKLTAICPSCGRPVVYAAGSKSVTCNACDTTSRIEDLQAGSRRSASNTSVKASISAAAGIIGFDNPESGIVFLENFFDTYNWAEYYDSDVIEIPEISEIVNSNKAKNGAAAQSWYLDFKSLAFPIAKKLEGLKVVANKIAAGYNSSDSSEALANFDNYVKIISALVASKDDILKRLESAIKFAERFGLENARLAEIKKDIKDIQVALNMLVKPETIYDIPEFIQAQAKTNEEIAKKLAADGVNAEALYKDATALFKAGGAGKLSALADFEKIRGYKDSVKYINKINNYFDFELKMFYFNDRYYIYKYESFSIAPLDLKNITKKGKKAEGNTAEEQESVQALALYEVVDGIPADVPVLRGIEKFITCYGTKYYYFKRNQGIFAFDLISHEETLVDGGVTADYVDEDGDYQLGFGLEDSIIFIKKKLHPVEKKGCLLKKKEEEKLLNNYNIVAIDLYTGKTSVKVPELVDIALAFDKEIFYIYAEKIEQQKKKPAKKKAPILGAQEEKDYNTILMCCDLATGECKRVLNDACEIQTVVDKKIIYTVWKPNQYNLDLRVYDLVANTDVLIESNVYDFLEAKDGLIFYTVGNKEFLPLVCNNFEGTARKEIMQNVERIVDYRAGWFYVLKGRKNDYNTALIKVSFDGSQRIVLCTQLKKIVYSTPTNIYYINYNNDFYVVRRDGKEHNFIGSDIDKGSVFVDENAIYYARKEYVGDNKNNKSLYKMDKDGKNVQKLVFDIDEVKDFDENALYYRKKEYLRFKVTIPTGKNTNEEFYDYFNLTRYYRYDKVSNTTSIVLTLGFPSAKNSYKTGCLAKIPLLNKFAKTIEADVVYEEAPIPREFKYNWLNKVGAVEEEADAQQNAEIQQAAENGNIVAKARIAATNFVDKIKKFFKIK